MYGRRDVFRAIMLLACLSASLQEGDFGWIKPASTGTTIVGCMYDEGVVLGADTRATRHNAISNKRTRKIHRISDRIYCCGAGVAADAAQLAAKIRQYMYKLQVSQQHTFPNSEESVGIAAAAAAAAEYMTDDRSQFEVGLIMGGMEKGRKAVPRLFQFSSEFPCGIAVQSCAMGSGMLAANSVLDSFQTRNRIDREGTKKLVLPSKDEAVRIVSKAVLAGIHNDLGSGSNVDICIIDADGATVMEPYIASPTARPKDGECQAVDEMDSGHHVRKSKDAPLDMGELVCSRRRAVQKLVFREGSARLHSSTDNSVHEALPFASIV